MTELLIKRFIKNYDKIDDPAVRRGYGTLSGGVGIFLNLLLSFSKFLAGVITGSIAITADAFNNLSDVGSSVVTLAGFRMAGKKADDDHPFGHGRIEYLSGLAVAAAVLLVGVELAKTSIKKILAPGPVVFSWLSVGILIASILVKLWMYFFNRGLSRRIGSAAMAATAADSLSDVAATSAVLLGTLVNHYFSLSIDGWVGILVAGFILRSGWGAAKDTLDPLLGQSPDRELVKGIRDMVLSHPEIRGIHDLIVHDYGPGHRVVSLHAEVPLNGDLLELHDIIDAAERELRQKYHLEATIHMDPIATEDAHVLAAQEMVEGLVQALDKDMTIHDFRMTNGPLHRNLIFDVVVPGHVKLSEDEVRVRLEQAVREADPGSFAVIQVDRSYNS